MFALGTVTLRPSPSFTSRTRAFDPEPSTAGSLGSADTVPKSPKYGSRIRRTCVPSSSAPSSGRAPCAGSGSPALRATTTSGRMTPARICVAPFTLASRPSKPLRSAKVRSAMAMSPKPSVTRIVSPIFSVPVIATPRS